MQPLPPHIAALPRPQGELEVIRHRSRLIVGRSRIVRTSVADTAVIEVVPYGEREIDVIGVALGTTTLTIWFENEPEPLIYVVRVVRDPGLEDRRRDDYGRLQGELRALFPSSRVTLIPLSYSVVVKGHAPSAAEAAKILEVVRREVVDRDCPPPGLRQEGIGQVPHGCRTGVEPGVGHCDVVSSVVSMLEVPGAPQVAIRVTAAELNRERLRRMGIDLGAVLQNGRPDVAPFAYGPPGNCGAILENGEAHALLNWLATSGAGQVLAEPSVVVVSGHAAEFHTGGEFAVPTVDGLAAASFRSYGTSLSVLPTVLDEGILRLQIRSARTEPDERTSVGGVPGLLSRRAATTVD
ncbi:MAG TPA: pilus assembly protein N-terminal domain-containing protein, partial [Planctomycetaceae bacterium]